MAYQGFVSGDPDKDAYPVRLFLKQGLNMAVVQSFSKNFGLYNTRAGCLSIPSLDPKMVSLFDDYLGSLVRSQYSNSPAFGSDIIKTIWGDKQLRAMWRDDIKTMSSWIKSVRNSFYDEITKQDSKHDWSYLVKQQGMFSFTQLSKE